MPRRTWSFLSAIIVLLGLGAAAVAFAPLVRALPPVDAAAGRGGETVDPAGGGQDPGDAALDPSGSGQGLAGGDPGGGGGEASLPTVPDDANKGYYLYVDIANQATYAYLDGALVRTMVCSTGTPEQPTPTGRFYIQNRGEEFFSEKYQQGGRWWVSFKDWGIYLFHSVPIDKNGDYIAEEAAKLGQPASHGCVRLAVEDARWIYDTIPEGVPVDIR